MADAQVVQGEIRTTEDGRTVLVVKLADRTIEYPLGLDEEGRLRVINGVIREDITQPDGRLTVNFHVPCLNVMGAPKPPNIGGLTLLEGSGTDG